MRRGKRKPRIQRVRSLIVDDAEGHIFPMRSLHDFAQRAAMYRNTVRPALPDVPSDTSDEQPLCHADQGYSSGISSGAEIAVQKKKDEEISFADY